MPCLTIAPKDPAERAEQHRWMLSLHEQLKEITASYKLHADPALDTIELDESCASRKNIAVFSNAAGRLKAFLRANVFDTWAALQPELSTVTGSFEIFNPRIGSNIEWHTDGWVAGTYLAHYYPDQGGDAAMNWFEVALPEPLEARRGDADYAAEGFDEEECALDFLSDDAPRKATIAPDNFLPFSLHEQKLVVFEDSEVYHRTPLTARAFPDIHCRRPIVRIDFYGRSSHGGETMAFRQPAAEGGEATERDVHTNATTTGCTTTPWRRLDAISIPLSLGRVCEAHALSVGVPAPRDDGCCGTVSEGYGSSNDSKDSSVASAGGSAVMRSFEAYLKGDEGVTAIAKVAENFNASGSVDD